MLHVVITVYIFGIMNAFEFANLFKITDGREIVHDAPRFLCKPALSSLHNQVRRKLLHGDQSGSPYINCSRDERVTVGTWQPQQHFDGIPQWTYTWY